MLMLILETSSEKGIALLARKGIPLKWTFLPKGPELSKKIALEVEKLLDSETPEIIAVGTGPGSFTGIRVGVALAKALSYGFKIPILGFRSEKDSDFTKIAKRVWDQFLEEGLSPLKLNYGIY